MIYIPRLFVEHPGHMSTTFALWVLPRELMEMYYKKDKAVWRTPSTFDISDNFDWKQEGESGECTDLSAVGFLVHLGR